LSDGHDRYLWSAGNHTLHINRLTFDDDGEYQCKASNRVGHRLFSIHLRVYSTIFAAILLSIFDTDGTVCGRVYVTVR